MNDARFHYGSGANRLQERHINCVIAMCGEGEANEDLI
jgi:hypothetical protein